MPARRSRRPANAVVWAAGPPARGQEVVKLACIDEMPDVHRWAGPNELAHDRSLVGPEQLERVGKGRDDLLHALLVREAGLEPEQADVQSLQRRVERGAAPVAEYGGAARTIIEQANLPIQQPLCHRPCRVHW